MARRYVGLRGLPDSMTEDVVQEAMSRTFSVWEIKLAMASCERRCGFVCITMSNVAHEKMREQRRNGEVYDSLNFPYSATYELNLENRHLALIALAAAIEALSTLGAEDRLILDLTMAEVSHAEIAAQLDLRSATNVSTRLSRIRNKLAKTVGPDLLIELGLRFGQHRSRGTT